MSVRHPFEPATNAECGNIDSSKMHTRNAPACAIFGPALLDILDHGGAGHFGLPGMREQAKLVGGSLGSE